MSQTKLLDDYIIQQLIGLVICKSREERSISQTMLAKMVKKSKQYISEIEKGFKRISIATTNEIFIKMDINFSYTYYEEIDKLYDKFIDNFNYFNLESALCNICNLNNVAVSYLKKIFSFLLLIPLQYEC